MKSLNFFKFFSLVSPLVFFSLNAYAGLASQKQADGLWNFQNSDNVLTYRRSVAAASQLAYKVTRSEYKNWTIAVETNYLDALNDALKPSEDSARPKVWKKIEPFRFNVGAGIIKTFNSVLGESFWQERPSESYGLIAYEFDDTQFPSGNNKVGRSVLIAYRGTDSLQSTLTDFKAWYTCTDHLDVLNNPEFQYIHDFFYEPCSNKVSNALYKVGSRLPVLKSKEAPLVHSGFLESALSSQDEIFSKTTSYLALSKKSRDDVSYIFTGHSLGAALSHIQMAIMLEKYYGALPHPNSLSRFRLITFGSPRSFGEYAAITYETEKFGAVNLLRARTKYIGRNTCDPVTELPIKWLIRYDHVGSEENVDVVDDGTLNVLAKYIGYELHGMAVYESNI